ncbi:elongation factor G [Aridibaculum aurantiacum]|uniref:elongation factor G n=1 Tax=Aridibaculum aurantiacum TaxID=2810307 RepID=UPI001A9720CE|nr:elongation factor G [Aridibaculum aurantiacum]
MPEFDTAHVKNVVLLGHSGSGKTTLAESMLYEAGMIHKPGSIEEKNTVADYTELEKERGNSIFSKLLHTHWKGYKINVLDTPGYDDFAGEVISALRVADTGVMLLNASTGVEVGTDIIWEYILQFKTPTIFVVNQLDHPQADFNKTVQEAKNHFGKNVVLVQYPVNVGLGFNAIIDVLNMVMYQYKDGERKPHKLPIPEEERARAEELHKELIEAIASNDETLMETYFDKGELTEDEMRAGLHLSMVRHDLFPVFCLSAKQHRGVARLMGYIDNVCPPSNEMPPQITRKGELLPCDSSGPACLFIFKTVTEPHVGDLSYFKVYSGVVKAGMELVNENTAVTEKLNQLFVIEGNKRIPVQELVAGDIGATLKLRNTHTNNTLHEKGKNLELEPIVFPEPKLSIAIANNKKGEEEKLATVLHQLQEEDPSIQVEVSTEIGQTLLHCQGDMHLAIIKWKLQHLFHLDVLFTKPRISYRETIRSEAEATYRHKKQSGGAGQFGEVTLRIEPWKEDMPEPHGLTVRGKEVHELPWGGKLVYYNCIVGGVIDTRFLPSIYKGIMERMQQGPLTGSFVRDIRVCVFDGKMHPVDSNDMAFKSAGMMAFKEAFQKADPQLLEPVYYVEVRCPEDLTGNVMGDLQMRRGMVEGMETEGHFTVIHAKVPHAELYQYASALRGLTQGRARFKMKFDHYAPVSGELQRRLTEAYRKEGVEAVAV